MPPTLKRLVVRILLTVVLLAVPCWCFATDPFEIRIVDEEGRGVADVRVADDTDSVQFTNAVGQVWFNPARFGSTVHLSIDRPGYWFPGGGLTIRVRRGGYTELTILRQASVSPHQ